jgi:hypothetical protein
MEKKITHGQQTYLPKKFERSPALSLGLNNIQTNNRTLICKTAFAISEVYINAYDFS